MTITLEAIEAQQSRITEMIAAFKAKPRATEYRIDAVTIPLAPGERFAGAILNDDGTLSHYLIKLPGEAESKGSWTAAQAYASECGGEAPTLRELALMRTNLRDEFEDEAYWSAEAHETDSSYAWYQGFDNGYQSGTRKSAALRAVAVRRFIPSVI
ncbi:DUF1566 domain-containing protein [Paraburkholderia sp. SIMBA_030]|uniref:DUF1566 domain-containing protein n=1 Tax=Paraburkholderia sp. SIMBA_030 TaxID=3085773 RepID=UPI00397AF43A